MTSRYYVTPPLMPGEFCLDDSEARHCFSVMRARAGDQVEVFDGEGRFASGTLVQCDRKRVRVSIQDVQAQTRSGKSLYLYVSLPKGDRQKWLVEKCVELGVASLTPLVTARSVAQPTEKALERLRRMVIEASKQCGRNHLMEVAEPMQFTDVLELAETDCHCWIAHPYEAAPLAPPDDQRPCRVLVGPEGGFGDEEVQRAEVAGWQRVALGENILRVETAALAIAALFVVT